MPIPSRLSLRALTLRCLVPALLAGLLALPSVAAALPQPTLLMTTGGAGNKKETPPSDLYSVDPATAATTSRGGTGFAITGLAQDPTTGILYGVSNAKSPIAPKTLLTIDPATGAATQVGPLGLIIADITFDSQGRLFGWSEENDQLASIDKATGAATEIGTNEIGTYGSGSAFDINDSYWLFPEGEGGGAPGSEEEGGFFTIDTATNKPTFQGKLTPLDDNHSPISAAAFDCARTTLYATVNNFGEPLANLVTIDTATGALSNKGTLPSGADGLEWYCPLAFEFAQPAIKVAAKKKTLTISVIRGPRIKGAASVNFATVPGSAKAGADFAAASGTLGFANNLTNGALTVAIKGNPKAGKNVKFQVALSNPGGGGTVGAPLQVTILAAKPKPAKISGPKQTSAGRSVFKLSSPQRPARFRCKLDKGKFKGCGKVGKKPRKFQTPPLAPGKHTLKVQVVNGAGKKAKPAKKVFTVLP